jgi:hypothetical protein
MDPIMKKISLQETKEALLRSGYLLEHRLETLLRKRGYYVEANESYPDPETGKSRELDIYAINAVKAGPAERDFIFSVLLAECINNPQPIAFMTKYPQVGFLHHQEVRVAGLPAKIPSANNYRSSDSLPEYLAMEKYHHYCKGRVSTQFCSFTEKKRQGSIEWMASHEDHHFDSFRKLAAAVDYHSSEHFKNWRFGGKEFVNLEFYYPLLVVQGELLDVRQGRDSLRVTPTNHIQYRMSLSLGQKQRTYQIDVVTERHFTRYLKLVDAELSRTARLLRRRHEPVRKAIEQIVRNAKRYRSPDKIRAAMDA